MLLHDSGDKQAQLEANVPTGEKKCARKTKPTVAQISQMAKISTREREKRASSTSRRLNSKPGKKV